MVEKVSYYSIIYLNAVRCSSLVFLLNLNCYSPRIPVVHTDISRSESDCAILLLPIGLAHFYMGEPDVADSTRYLFTGAPDLSCTAI